MFARQMIAMNSRRLLYGRRGLLAAAKKEA
jgi:hypothetical protein